MRMNQENRQTELFVNDAEAIIREIIHEHGCDEMSCSPVEGRMASKSLFSDMGGADE